MISLLLLSVSLAADAPINWHADAFFGLHYDLHPNEQDTELGRETTYEHIREQLEKVKPDFVQYDCKGHPGWSGYPTEVGSPSPGIVNDALRIWRDVTRDMGIPLSIHYSGVWDTRAIQLHPDWANIGPDGKPNANNTCPLSPYTEELMIPQLLEVVEKYDLDGMWIDGENWASQPCYCERCKGEFTRRTGIGTVPTKPSEEHWADWLEFHRALFVEHVTKYTNAVHAKDPAVMVCSNWMYSVRQPEPIAAPIDYISGDFDPSFGADRACAEARFISNRGKPWDLMAWSFLRTGDLPWVTKTVPHLCQELSVVMAQGGATFIYDQPQRSGRLTGWHQDILGQVAAFCRKRQPYSHKTQTIPQVALLHSQSFFYRNNQPLFNFAKANQPMEGALHALLENGYSVDILNEDDLVARMGEYPLVVVPEQEGLPPAVSQALEAYVQGGGRLLLTGSHVARQHGELAGVEPVQGSLTDGYVPAGNGCTSAGAVWQKVTRTTSTEIAPLLDRQEPELNQAETPAATLRPVGSGRVAAIHGDVFRSYYAGHYPGLREFVGDVVQVLDTPGLARVHGPWWIEMSARKKDGRTLIQFVNRSSSGPLSPNRHMVEDVPNTGPFTVAVPVKEKPARCYMAPDETGLNWSWKDGVLTAEISGLAIHNVLVIE
ncbi:MAG: hypothetical protein NTZ09_12520 [Candidatus Hydrogenedentes bacterium]|nr:hypothetical protein [Candidatus Hydrogenedentota bacterium]